MTTADKITALATCAVFAGVPASERALLAEMMGVERLDAGEILFQAGDLSDRVYLVVDGRLRVFLPNVKHRAPARAA